MLSLNSVESTPPWFLTEEAWPRVQRRLHGLLLTVIEENRDAFDSAFAEAAEEALPEVLARVRDVFANELSGAAAALLMQETLLSLRARVEFDRVTRQVTVSFAPRGEHARRLLRSLRFGTSEMPALDVWAILEGPVRKSIQPVLARTLDQFRTLVSETLL